MNKKDDDIVSTSTVMWRFKINDLNLKITFHDASLNLVELDLNDIVLE